MSTTFAPRTFHTGHTGHTRHATARGTGRGVAQRTTVRRVSAQYAVVVPPRVRTRVTGGGHTGRRPSGSVFVRRRLAVLLVVVATAAALGLGVGTVLASRGGDPASASAARPANPGGTAAYPARAGDTMWSIAAMFCGERSHADYLDDLIRLNGGRTEVGVGQLVLLP